MLLLPILQFPFSDILFPLQTCATREERRRRRKRRARAAAILIDCGACGQRADQDRRRGRRRGSRWTTTTNGDGMVRFPLPFFPSTKVGGKEGKATPRLPDRGREGGRERGPRRGGRRTVWRCVCIAAATRCRDEKAAEHVCANDGGAGKEIRI